MKSGKLDRTVTIERLSAPGDDGYTTTAGTWVKLVDRAAQVIYSRGREVLENQGVEADIPVVFLLRYDSVTRTITAEDRIIFDGRIIDLKSVTEIDRRDGVECLGVARANAREETPEA